MKSRNATDFPYVRERSPQGRMAELEAHGQNVHAHFSEIWELKSRPPSAARDLGVEIQQQLREMRRLIDDIEARGEHPSADALWVRLGLWPEADERPLEGNAREALATLLPQQRAELGKGRQWVVREQPEWEQRLGVRRQPGRKGRRPLIKLDANRREVARKARRLQREGKPWREITRLCDGYDRKTFQHWIGMLEDEERLLPRA